MAPFTGWSLPIEYAGIRHEHLAVRRSAGAFDVSHMGQIETRGPGATALLQRLLSNDVDTVAVGGAQYALLCRPDGGIIDDLVSYRLEPDRWLTVTNASNHRVDLAWFRDHAGGFDADVVDRAGDFAMIAVQGPSARTIVASIAGGALPERFRAGSLPVAGADALVCGTGYTGEDGVEILCAPAEVGAVWRAVLAQGAVPCGLGARDTLRIEACFPLYGNDLSTDRDPIAAGLGWCCAEATGFIGSDAVGLARVRGPSERLVPFVVDGPGIPRAGNEVVDGGVVTSGTLSPCLGRGAGLAYVPTDAASPGSELVIDVRGRLRRATVVTKPIHLRRKPADG
ncbi:Aminomethyltransferase [Capillimicrobium parvum]|uniref:aminomethyltransferase n=2 Tax=Capillimicrobium parvum TaxID=2884022 RepID=A0A9E6Y0K5_9ACTN|nr:Aminomethyltransferase [Capillimicrobium parvum]